MSETNEIISVWTVYDHPKDFPLHYVARRHDVQHGELRVSTYFVASFSLRTLRNHLESLGLHYIPRREDDDPLVVEMWI
jgi:hypothetical protein